MHTGEDAHKLEWQDISTAPKDGRQILATLFEDYPALVWWYDEPEGWKKVETDRYCMPLKWIPEPPDD